MPQRVCTRSRAQKTPLVTTMSPPPTPTTPETTVNPPKRRPRRRGRRSGVGRNKARKALSVAPALEAESQEEAESQPDEWPSLDSNGIVSSESPVATPPSLSPVLTVFNPIHEEPKIHDSWPLLDTAKVFSSPVKPTSSLDMRLHRKLPLPLSLLPPPPSTLPRILASTPPSRSPRFIGKQLPINANELPETKPPCPTPKYTAAQIGVPIAYNTDYPHPVSVYLSPAVNPAAVRNSGYAPLFAQLDKNELRGKIISECRSDICAPALRLKPESKEGCGIPEEWWVPLCDWAGVKVPMGAILPAARATRRMSLDHSVSLTKSRSEMDLQAHKVMGPRRASLPNLYSKSVAELPTRFIRNPPPEVSRHRRLPTPPWTALSTVDEADDEVAPPVKRPIEPIGAERARLSNVSSATGVGRDTTPNGLASHGSSSSLASLVPNTPTLNSYFPSTSTPSVKSEPTGFEGLTDEQMMEFVSKTFTRFRLEHAAEIHATHKQIERQYSDSKPFNDANNSHWSKSTPPFFEGRHDYTSPTSHTLPGCDLVSAIDNHHLVNTLKSGRTSQEEPFRFVSPLSPTVTVTQPNFNSVSRDAHPSHSQPAATNTNTGHLPTSLSESIRENLTTLLNGTHKPNMHVREITYPPKTNDHSKSSIHNDANGGSFLNQAQFQPDSATRNQTSCHTIPPSRAIMASKAKTSPTFPCRPSGNLPEHWDPQPSTTLEFSTGMSIWT